MKTQGPVKFIYGQIFVLLLLLIHVFILPIFVFSFYDWLPGEHYKVKYSCMEYGEQDFLYDRLQHELSKIPHFISYSVLYCVSCRDS